MENERAQRCAKNIWNEKESVKETRLKQEELRIKGFKAELGGAQERFGAELRSCENRILEVKDLVKQNSLLLRDEKLRNSHKVKLEDITARLKELAKYSDELDQNKKQLLFSTQRLTEIITSWEDFETKRQGVPCGDPTFLERR